MPKRTRPGESPPSPTSPIQLSSGYYAKADPYADARSFPTLAPDWVRFMQNVMRAERQMPTASTRSPEQDLLITYLQNKDKQRMLVDQGVEAQKRKSPTQSGSPTAKQKATVKQDLVPFHEQQIASASGAASVQRSPESQHEPKGLRGRPRSTSRPAASSSSGPEVKAKPKVQEIYELGKKFTSNNYNAWEALSATKIYDQLKTYYKFDPGYNRKAAHKHKDKMLEFAENVVPLTRSKPTTQDS
jgi:hypothetical protein